MKESNMQFIYFEDSWNEQEKKTEKGDRRGEVQSGRTSPTSTSSNDSEGSRG